MFAARDDDKTPPKHVEADTFDVSGRGFNSPRLHSTRCARSWQAASRVAARRAQKDAAISQPQSSESNALSER